GSQEPWRWDPNIEEQNVSRERLRTSRWRDAVVDFPGMRSVRRAFVPQSIRNAIKGWWSMRERPQLSETSLRRLRGIFDRDLNILGGWLGIPLSCETFAAAASVYAGASFFQSAAAETR